MPYDFLVWVQWANPCEEQEVRGSDAPHRSFLWGLRAGGEDGGAMEGQEKIAVPESPT